MIEFLVDRGASLKARTKKGDTPLSLAKKPDSTQLLTALAAIGRRKAVEKIVKVYESWHAAKPDKGYAAKAAEWRAKLPENDD
jgi:hypothetical protein